MADQIFAHPRLAAVYDTFDGDRGDLDAYLALAEELGAREVLDVGCGTGNLGARLAARGHTVVGVDPAAASLAIARTRSDHVTWIEGDATTLPPLQTDLAVMTGNVAQVFLTDEQWDATVRGVHAALRPGGHFVFETRRPEARDWERWATGTEPVIRDVPGIGPVEQCHEMTEVRLPFVSFRYTYRFPDGEVLTSDSTLRFRDRAELTAGLTANGFRVREVREAPDRPGLEFVFVAQRG